MTYKCKHLNNQDALDSAEKQEIKCKINRITKNNCQTCRFDLCIGSGMSEYFIRTKSVTSNAPTAILAQDSNINKPIYSLEIDDRILLEQQTSIGAQKVPSGKSELPIEDASQIFNSERAGLALSAYEKIIEIVQWSLLVLGYSKIPQPDQLTYLKTTFPDIMAFRLAWRSMQFEEKLKFSLGKIISKNDCVRKDLGVDVICFLFSFVKNAKELNIDMHEFAIIQAILLTFARCSNVHSSAQKDASEIQNRMMQCLRRHFKTFYALDVVRYCTITQLLSEVKGVNLRIMDCFFSAAINGCIPLTDFVVSYIT